MRARQTPARAPGAARPALNWRASASLGRVFARPWSCAHGNAAAAHLQRYEEGWGATSSWPVRCFLSFGVLSLTTDAVFGAQNAPLPAATSFALARRTAAAGTMCVAAALPCAPPRQQLRRAAAVPAAAAFHLRPPRSAVSARRGARRSDAPLTCSSLNFNAERLQELQRAAAAAWVRALLARTRSPILGLA